MMNRSMLPVGLVSGLALGAGLALAQSQHEPPREPASKPQAAAPVPKCPVTGEPVNLAVSVATDDGPVFFCCKDCIPKYEAKPGKYAAKVAVQRKALSERPKVQVTCPVSGEPVDQKVFVEHDGSKVYFCCKGCTGKYQKEPEKYKAALANSYTYQTKCPVMGEEINPKARIGKIYFCCKGCDKKFFNDPAQYAPKLEAQGFKFDPTELKAGATGEASRSPGHGSHDPGHHGHDHDH